MGTIIAFPVEMASRRRERGAIDRPATVTMATVTILPAIRIERHADVAAADATEKGAASKRRRKHGRIRS